MLKIIILGSLLALAPLHANAADVANGKSKAVVCSGCHGVNGISLGPEYPNLAGQKAAYVTKQLKAFKSGTRIDPIMQAMASPLSDQDMKNIAAYFESLK